MGTTVRHQKYFTRYLHPCTTASSRYILNHNSWKLGESPILFASAWIPSLICLSCMYHLRIEHMICQKLGLQIPFKSVHGDLLDVLNHAQSLPCSSIILFLLCLSDWNLRSNRPSIHKLPMWNRLYTNIFPLKSTGP